ncbi:MAG TPA: hypothetical protein VFS59_15780 [Gemmatimonadaceae bacterium]|nr:hypothetical protein [Gemmatimonadaceae bacterium]
MSDHSSENVPRGDHVPGGPNDAATAEINQKAERAERGVDSPSKTGQGDQSKDEGGETPGESVNR